MNARFSFAGLRILVVEDEFFIADDISEALVAAGAEVLGPASRVADALRLLEKGGVDGAILDINLRDEFSYPIADILVGQRTPFLFATGYNGLVVPPRFNTVRILGKPFDPGVAIEELGQVIGGATGG